MTFRSTLLALALLTSTAACGDAEPPAEGAVEETMGEATEPTMEHEHMDATGVAPGAEPAAPRMEDGVQVVEIEAGRMGFAPRQVALEAGVPARLVFTRTVESECSEQVQVPAFGVEPVDLPLNEAVEVEFTPDEDGSFTFVCGMDMQKGTLVVRV